MHIQSSNILAQFSGNVHFFITILFVAIAAGLLIVGAAWMNRRWRKGK